MKHTRFEKARVIGARALQISMGAPFILKLGREDLERLRYSPLEIAKLEYEKDLIPIAVKRPLPTVADIEQKGKKKGVKGMQGISSAPLLYSEVEKMDSIEFEDYEPDEDDRDPDDEDNW